VAGEPQALYLCCHLSRLLHLRENPRRIFRGAGAGKIGRDHIRAYQRARTDTVGASQINKEYSVLQQMLKRAGLWDGIESDYQPLPLPKESSLPRSICGMTDTPGGPEGFT
jgi:hypothetical protein